jgi:DNA-binding transcriptional regulator LsrR (DeoR family)
MVHADLTWDEHELLARVAHRWYIDGRTQDEIARDFGLSRPKVQRLLERARAAGVVEIHVQPPMGVAVELEGQLLRTFGLRDASVSSRADPPEQRLDVARNAARYLERRLHDGMVVAVSHGRDVGEVSRFFRPAAPIDCVFASAMSGSPRVDAPTNPNEICRTMAERCGGRAESLFAPAYVESIEVRDRLVRQEAVAQALQTAAGADMALVGVGGTDDDCTMVRSGSLSLEAIAELRGQGAVGDVLGNFFDLDGQVIPAPHVDRLVGLTIDDLRRFDSVVAVASGPEKPRAVVGALRIGIIDVLVVDESNAREALTVALTGGA